MDEPNPPAIDITRPVTTEELLPLVYNDLRRLASARLREEEAGHTLQTTALVHEAYLRLLGNDARNWNGQTHFFAAAGEAMRRILVEHARAKQSQKRGGGQERIVIDLDHLPGDDRTEAILAISDAVEVLAELDPMSADLLKLRYFAGFSLKEAEEALGLTQAEGTEHWRFARAWLKKELE